jgi:glycosyltransferase involved in cell wall biosynthesis
MRRGIEVHVVCSSTQIEAQSRGETIYPVVKRWDRGGVAEVQKIVKTVEPDWIIVQMVAYAYQNKGLPFGMLPLYRDFKRDNRQVLTIFHEIRIRPEGNIKKWVISRLQTYYSHQLCKMSTKIVTSIDFYARILKRWQDKLTIIPIGSNILPVALTPQTALTIKSKHGIPEKAILICTFGNRDISPYLPAFDRLAADNPQLIWLIAGRTQTPSVVLQSRQYIRYVGEMSAADIYRHLALGDVFFMPDPLNAKGEGGTSNKSGSLACACSLHLPIVATKGNLNNALLMEDEKLILVDINNEAALYDALKKCLDNEALRLRLGNKAYQFYEKELTWRVLANKILKTLDFELKYRKINNNGSLKILLLK